LPCRMLKLSDGWLLGLVVLHIEVWLEDRM